MSIMKREIFTSKPSLTVNRQKFAAARASGTADTSEKITLTGYAIVWNTLSDDRGGFFVRFLPGSAQFADPTHALFHHDFRAVLGSTANKSLRILPDDTGVKVEIDLPNTTQANDVATLVDKGYVGGMSFSMLFDEKLVTTNKTESGQDVMEVSAFTCDEVTITAIPAFTATSISVKADETPVQAPATQAEPAAMAHIRNDAPERVAESLKLQQMKLNHYSV